MAEEKTRIDKVREYLYEAEEPVRPKTIAEAIGESSLNVGKDLHRLKEQGQAESEGDGLWKMTDEGKEALEGGGGREKGKGEKGREISETVPSQSDLLLVVPLRVGGVDVQLPGRGRNTSGNTYSKSGATNKGGVEWLKYNYS